VSRMVEDYLVVPGPGLQFTRKSQIFKFFY